MGITASEKTTYLTLACYAPAVEQIGAALAVYRSVCDLVRVRFCFLVAQGLTAH